MDVRDLRWIFGNLCLSGGIYVARRDEKPLGFGASNVMYRFGFRR